MENKIELLIKAREAYYNKSKPIMTDQEYEALEEKMKQDYPDHPFFETVGHPPSSLWKTEKHKIFMGSLEKVNSEEELLKWADKFFKSEDISSLPLYNISRVFVMQLKLDGLSLSQDYVNSKFVRALTRGDGFEGENISDNVRLMKNFKETVPGFTGSIRSEIILPRTDFENINSILSEKDKYSNPRNAASGISRRLDGKFCKYLQLIAYDIELVRNYEELDEHEKIRKLNDLGIVTVKQAVSYIPELIPAFRKLKEHRKNLPYDIDGVVFKVNSHTIQKEFGIVRNRPKAQIALKFDPPGAATTFLKEMWDVGRTGVVTPLALLEPVEIEGSTIRKATLHNVAEIKRLGIGHGDTVMVVKRGDIIPKIISVIEHKGKPIQIPIKCPSCDSDLINDDIRLICPFDGCPKKNFYRVMNWIKVTGIDEYGESLGKELEEASRVKCIADLYKLKENDISIIEGWGTQSAKKIIDNINKTKILKPEIFLAAIGIPGISERTSEELLKAFDSIDELMKKDASEIKKIKGFSDISASTIVLGLKKYQSEIQELSKIITLSSHEQGDKLSGLSFCFTGAMENSRSYYQKLVEEHGGINKSSVTKDLSCLVCNENKGSTKSQRAEKFGIKTINEKEFLEMIGDIQSVQSDKPKIENYSLFE